MNRGRPRHKDILTPREWQVLGLVRDGLTNDQVADRLSISANTVKFHVSEIISKLGVSSREEAASWLDHERWRRHKLAGWSLFGPAKLLTPKAALGSAAVVGTIVLVVLFVMALDNRSQPVGQLGKIVYIDGGDLWVKALPSGKPQRLTHDGEISNPSWSPSGQWLSFVKGSFGVDPWPVTWVMKSDGSKRQRIDTPSFVTFWSPRTDDLAYYGQDGSLVVQSADGSGRLRVVPPFKSATEEGGISGAWAWSPDGNWLAYVYQRWPAASVSSSVAPLAHLPAIPRPTGPERTYAGIWLVGADGSGAREVLNMGEMPQDGVFLTGWSADGSDILFAINPGFSGESGGPPALILEDGLPLRAVSIHSGQSRDLGITTLYSFRASSSVRSLALVDGTGNQTWSDKRIAIVDPTTRELEHLTDSDTAAISPAWSPDGSAIAYVASPDARLVGRDLSLNSRRIWTMAPDGSNNRQLTSDESYRDEFPQWTLDGKSILFARMEPEACASSGYSLWLLDANDGSVQKITSELPLFSRDNWVRQVGEVPDCRSGTHGLISEYLGLVSFSGVFDWWQSPPRDHR